MSTHTQVESFEETKANTATTSKNHTEIKLFS